MDWKEYAKELLIFQVKVFSLPIEDVSKEKILNDEDLIFGNPIDDVNTGPGGVDASVTLGEVAEMNMTNQDPRFLEDL